MKLPASQTAELLISALRPSQTARNWEALVNEQAVNWNDLVIRAIAFGLAPMLHRRITDWNLALPGTALAKLTLTRKASAQRNSAIAAQLEELLLSCNTVGIEPIVLKGAYLAQYWYVDPSLRPMNDIDLLFGANEMERVHTVLTELGYRGKWKSADLGPGVTKHTSTYRRNSADANTPNPYLSMAGDRMIEPHISLEESWFGLKVDITPGMRQRALPHQFGAATANALDPEDLLLHLCIHLSFHLIMGAPSLVQLVDFIVVLGKQNQIDWDMFLVRTRSVQAQTYVWAALRIVETILDIAVPKPIMQALSKQTSAGFRSYIDAFDLTKVLSRTQQSPLNTTMQRLRRGVDDRLETARWAPTLPQKIAVWQTAFQILRSDTGRQLLGRA